MTNLKQELFKLCVTYVSGRKTLLEQAIADAREASNNDTKSSAGDKYETGREMMQQDIDMNQTRLNELGTMNLILEKIDITNNSMVVIPGSIVQTTNGNYFIAISAGQLKSGNTSYYAISSVSPIGSKMMYQKVGYSFSLNGKEYTIKDIW
ncbi:MAG: 3-oxoacyl-ACP synthase [Bacteroidota bacterium]